MNDDEGQIPRLCEQLKAAFEQGEYDRALDLAREILTGEPDNWTATYLMASIKSLPSPEFYDPDSAVALTTAAVEARPDQETRWIGLTEVQTSCGQYEQAQRTYQEVLNRWPDSYQALVGLALLYGHPGVRLTLTESQQLLERAISTSPERGEAYYYLGAQKKNKGELSEARSLLERAVALLHHESPIWAAADTMLRATPFLVLVLLA